MYAYADLVLLLSDTLHASMIKKEGHDSYIQFLY